MKLFVPNQTDAQETRVPLLPVDARKLAQLSADVEVQSGIGRSLAIDDHAYQHAGARISTDRQVSLAAADMVLSISVDADADIHHLKPRCIYVACIDPFNKPDLVRKLAARKVSALSLEMIPRTTIAQKMDVLSSQASLAGYVAVILAARRQQKIFPMMMTPAGTIPPVRVFVIGAGVAGLQAIATAKRLGARVEAFDVRPEARDQILSLGAKPIRIDLGPVETTKQGYAGKLTEEQLEKQREIMAKQCAISDVVITTAKTFGKKAPLIVTDQMLDAMKPGSIVIDLAIETGGNVEASQPGKEIERNGVKIIALPELQRHVPEAASRMFSNNLCNFVEHFWAEDARTFVLDRDSDIIRNCLITYQGEIVNPTLKEALG